MDKRNTIISGCAVLLLCVVAAWGFGLFGGTDPAVAKLQDLSNQMAEANLPQVQQDQLRSQFREQMGTLTDDQRRAFFDANRDQWQARGQEQMNAFFAMSKADQQKRLDEIIARMSQPRPNQQAGASGNRGGANNGGGRGSMTEAQREERSKRRLDGSSPKMRAQFAEFRKRLDQRAQERGVKLDPGHGFGGRPGV